MRMIGCVSPVTAGTLRILGLDPAHDGAAIRARLGVVPAAGHARHRADRPREPADLRPLLRPLARASRRRAGRRAARLRPAHRARASAKVEPLSGGMKRRLTIARVARSTSPTCCCSTSRRPASTRRPATSSGTGSTGSSSRASRSCSPRTTWTRPSSSATGSWSWTTARSSPRARRGELIERVLDARGRSSCASPRRAGAAGRRLRRSSAERVEELPDRVLLYTATATRPRPRRTSAGCRRIVARPPQHARGRVPAPDRPHARGLTWRAVLQPLPRVRALARAVQAASGAGRSGTSSRQPAALPAGDRGRPRHASSTSTHGTRSGGVPYLDYVAPGLLAAAAMQTATIESSWPVHGGDQVVARLPRDDRHAADRARTSCVGHSCFVITAGVHSAARLPRGDRRFRRRHVAGGLLAIPAAVLIGLAFATPMAASRRARRATTASSSIFRFADHADVPLLRHVLPDLAAARSAFDWLALRHAALARRRALPDAHARHGRARAGARPPRRTCSRARSSASCWRGARTGGG